MRVLIVGDERALASSLTVGLRADGFTVDVARDGKHALSLARAMPYVAIVLNLGPPDMAGYEAARLLRTAQVWTPVMLMTRGKIGGEVDALDVCATDLLENASSTLPLLARIRAVIRCSAPLAPVELVVGDLALDPVVRSCHRHGTRIELTPREFSVLEYLMRRSGQVVPKSDILNDVWDVGDYRDPNVVEVYVGYVRRKIDAPFGRRTLETVRGHGYRLYDDTRRAARG